MPIAINVHAESARPDSGTADQAADLHELLTVAEVAALLRVSERWVYEHTRTRGGPRAHRLPHVKVGKYLRFEEGAVRAYLRAGSKLA